MDKKPEIENEWSTYWLERWNTKNIKFHQGEIEPFLEKHFPKMDPSTVFAPLCGKSKDLLFFARKGHRVIGVELSEEACEAFFLENGIEHQREAVKDFFIYRSTQFTIYCGDYFKLTPTLLEDVTFVYDRAALIALPKEVRAKYAEHLFELVVQEGHEKLTILLITLEYSSTDRQGPPFSVNEDEIGQLYGEAFQIRKLDSEADVDIGNTHAEFKHSAVFEHVYLLSQK